MNRTAAKRGKLSRVVHEQAERLIARLRQNPDDAHAYAALRILYRRQGDFHSLANLVEGWAGHTSDPLAASQAFREAAQLAHREIGDQRRAKRLYQQALSCNRFNTQAYEELRALLEATGEHNRLLQLVEAQIRALESADGQPHQVALLHFHAGEIWSKHFGRPDEALPQYFRAVELDPGLLAAIYEARQVCLSAGDLGRAADLYEAEARAEQDAIRRSLLLRELARLRADHLGEMQAAVAALNAALEAVPGDIEVMHDLAGCLIKLSETRDAQSGERDRERAADLLYDISRALPDEDAISYLASGLGCAPHHERCLELLEQLAGRTGQQHILPAHWVRYAASAPPGPKKDQRHLQLARAYVETGQLDDAVYCLEQVSDPNNLEVNELLGQLRAQVGPAPLADEEGSGPELEFLKEETPLSGQEQAFDFADAPELSSDLLMDEEPEVEAPPAVPPALQFDEQTAVGAPPVEQILATRKREREIASLPSRSRTDNTPTANIVLIDQLRTAMQESLAAGREKEAAEYCSEILALEPDDDTALRFLRRWYGDRSEYEQIRDLLLDRVHGAGMAPQSRAQCLKRAALISDRMLGDVDKASEYLVQTLDLVRDDEAAVQQLCDTLDRAGKHEQLVELLRERVVMETEREGKIALYRRIARITAERMQDEEEAAETWENLLTLTEDGEALAYLYKFASSQNDAERLADIVPRLAALESDPGERLNLLLHHARQLSRHLGRPKEAIGILQTILADLDPECQPAIEELAAACEAGGDQVSLCSALEQLLACESRPDERVAVLQRLAGLYESVLEDVPKAIGALQAWCDERAGDPEPYRRLCPLLEREQRFEELVSALDAQASAESDVQARTKASLRAAELSLAKLEDREGAWNRLVPLLEDSSGHTDNAIIRLATETGHFAELCDVLEDAGKYRQLVDLLAQRAPKQREPEAAAELYRRMAHISATRLKDGKTESEAWKKVLELREDPEALDYARRVAQQRDDAAELAEVLGRLAAIQTDSIEQRNLLLERAQLLKDRLDRPNDAVEVLRRIVEELDPECVAALEQLAQACEMAGDRSSLAVALQGLLAIERRPEERAVLARRLAELCESDLENSSRAIAALRSWCEAQPTEPEPYRRLCLLLEREQRFEELIWALDKLATLEPNVEARTQAALRAAELVFSQLKDADGAWNRLLPLANTGSTDADEAISKLAHQAGRLEELCDLLDSGERFHELVQVLRTRVEAEAEPGARVELYRRIAQTMSDGLQDEDGAAEAWKCLLEIQEDLEALSYLRWLAAKRDDAEQLATILNRLANLETDPAELCDLLLEYAVLLSTRLGRHEDAVDILRNRIREIDPHFKPAIEELISLSEASGDHAVLAEALERLMGLRESPDARIAIAQRLVDIAQAQVEDKALAIRALSCWAKDETEDPEPHRRLRSLLEETESWAELVQTLDTLSRLEPDEEAREEAARRAAEVAFSKLQDADGAWNRLLPLVRTRSPEADKAAHELARKAGREAELAGVYAALAQEAAEPAGAAALWTSAARVYEEYLDDPAKALEAALRMLAIDLSNTSFLEEVERLAVKAQAWPRMAQVYNRLVSQAADTEARVALLVRYADILERNAEDPSAALQIMLKVCSLQPGVEEWLERTERLCLRANNYAELLSVYQLRLADAQTEVEHVELLLESARVLDEHMRDREQAQECLQRAIESARSSPELLDRVERAAQSFDEKRPDQEPQPCRRAVAAAYTQLAASADEALAWSLISRASRLLSAELGDDEGAFEVLRQALSRFACHSEVYLATEKAADKLGRLGALDAHLARMLEEQPQERETVWLLEKRLQLLENRLGRFDEAADVCRQLLELNPDSESARDSLRNCLEKAGRYQDLVRFLQQQVDAVEDTDDKLVLLRELADLWEHQLKNRWEALEVWSRIHEMAPDSRQAAEAVRRLNSANPSSWKPPGT